MEPCEILGLVINPLDLGGLTDALSGLLDAGRYPGLKPGTVPVSP
jgi:hypothetical protein